MAPPHTSESIQKEGRVLLAVHSFRKGQISSRRAAASTYNAPPTTVGRRLKGIPPKRGSKAKNRKLLQCEEEVLVKWIYSMERRGFPPHIIDVRRMAQTLLAQRGSNASTTVGKHWVYKFLRQHPDLDARLARMRDSQRAKNEDPKIINEWFQRVQKTRQEYGITDDDTYNFDETGFAMGMAISGSSKVVTTASVGRATVIQPGNRKWVTVIEGINACGWTIPPFVIVEGKVHLSTWYEENPDLPSDWTIAVSDNGWTTDALGFHWIQHFDKWTKSRVVGQYRLLILDGHGSHATPEFDSFCAENKIITLCMPSHTSHILQPLDVACFSPVKTAYGQLVQDLARKSIFHVDKADFLGMYQHARTAIHSGQNIASGFRATGLIPFNPERVLSALTVTKTPSPPTTSHSQQQFPWTSETPKNLDELAKQVQLVQDAFQRQSQSPTEPLAKVVKGCQLAMSGAVLLAQENAELRSANEHLQRKKRQRRSHLQKGGVLQVQEARQLILEREGAAEKTAAQATQQGRQRAPRTCSCCGSQDHTARTCNLVKYAS
jgi:hypothetical protein